MREHLLQQILNCRLGAVQEHANFVEGLRIHHRNWKEVAAHVGTKTVVQVRSHAQKWFIQMQKKGRGDMVPPTNSELKHQQALRAAQVEPGLLCASTGNPTDLAGDSGALEAALAATQLGRSQDCTSESVARRPSQLPTSSARITVTVAPQGRQQPSAPADATAPASAATPTGVMPPATSGPLLCSVNHKAMAPHNHGQAVLCSVPYTEGFRSQGMAQWMVPSAAHVTAGPDLQGHPAGGMYVVSPPPEAVTQEARASAPARTKHTAPKAAEGMSPADNPPAGLFSSLVDRDNAADARPAAAAEHTRGKAPTDYASMYSFLASCFDLTNSWQELVSSLTRMPGKDRQLTVTLMGRVLNQMESRMQHTRGTAPPGWNDLHDAAKATRGANGAAEGLAQHTAARHGADPEAPALEASTAAPAALAAAAKELPMPEKAVPRHAAPEGVHAQQPCNGTQMHAPAVGATQMLVAVSAALPAPLWAQHAMPGAHMVNPTHWAGPAPSTPDMDGRASQRAGSQQCEQLGRQRTPLPSDQPMSDPSGFPRQQAPSQPQAEARAKACAHTGATPTHDHRSSETRQPQNASHAMHIRPVSQQPQAAVPVTGGLRSMPFHKLMPTMQGPQSLAARAAFDARFDVGTAGPPAPGPRMSEVQVHGARPVAQQMIPTPAIPADKQAHDPRQAHGSSGEDTTPDGALLEASASAADYLMGSAADVGLDSCMDGEDDEPPQPSLDLGMQQAPPTAMWMTTADGELVSQSAAHSATLCATDTAWTVEGNGGGVQTMQNGAEAARPHVYGWQHQGWMGSPPPGMSPAPPGMHVPLHTLLQRQHQLQRDKMGHIMVSEDGSVPPGMDLPPSVCMAHMHEKAMGQQHVMGALPASPAGEGCGAQREGNGKVMMQYGGAEAGRDGRGGPMQDVSGAAREEWLQECRQRQQQVPPWAPRRQVM
eukprot:jgi/Ulvmu1/9319/UM050_0068.1